ncbi:MAG: L-threonylcarbamoyladenylate synthase, partial [Actinomycetota bacterium]|nr:L-threonylcarbamoyladenylate synthase [Actinomycetota bacterium]
MLRAGGLVGFPTETVYGLGAHAGDPAAVRRLFGVKGRPSDNPLIVHLADAGLLESVAGRVSPLAQALAGRWWPGPLTLVVTAAGGLPPVTTGGLATVAVRVPAHPVA